MLSPNSSNGQKPKPVLNKIGKCNGANEYEVVIGGKPVGWLTREYYKSAGRWAAQYVGHYDGGYEWVYEPDDLAESRKTFDSFKKAEAFVNELAESHNKAKPQPIGPQRAVYIVIGHVDRQLGKVSLLNCPERRFTVKDGDLLQLAVIVVGFYFPERAGSLTMAALLLAVAAVALLAIFQAVTP